MNVGVNQSNISVKDIRVNKYNIYTNKPIRETRILNVPDVHYKNDRYTYKLESLKDLIKEVKPDLICIPGDFVDTFDDVGKNKQYILDYMDQISKLAFTAMSFAAHDYYSKLANKEELLQRWFTELNSVSNNFHAFVPDENITIQLQKNLSLSGYSPRINYDYNTENNGNFLENLVTYIESLNLINFNYNLFLCHSSIPFFKGWRQGLKTLKELGTDNINLVLSGHNHASLTPKFLEFLNLGLISADKRNLFVKNVSGLFSSEEDFNVAISRGFLKIPGTIKDDIGMLGNLIYRINPLFKSDVDLITVEGQVKSKVLS